MTAQKAKRSRASGTTAPPSDICNRILHFILASGFLLIPFGVFPGMGNGYTEPKWVVVNFLAGIAALVMAFSKRESIQLKNLGILSVLLAAGIAVMLITAVFTSFPRSTHYLLNRLSFLVLAFAFYRYGTGLWNRWTRLFVVIPNLYVLGHFVLQIIRQPIWPLSYFEHSSNFGHINMLAQYLGFSSVLLWHFFRTVEAPSKYFFLAFVFLNVGAISLTGCRSVQMAVFIIGALALVIHWARRKNISKRVFKLTLSAVLAICLLVLLYQARNISSIKVDNSKFRLLTWIASLHMIRDYPLGTGLAGFEYTFIGYKIRQGMLQGLGNVEKSPHNEFLRFAVEDGLLVCALFAAFYFLLFRRYISLSRNRDPRERDHIRLFLAFLALEMIFQFPIENAYPFWLFAYALGIVLHALPDSPFKIPPIAFRSSAVIVGVLILFGGSSLAYSTLLQNDPYGTAAEFRTACKLLPSEWRTCMGAARLSIKDGDIETGQKYVEETLRQHIYQFQALQYYGALSARKGDHAEACRAFFLKGQLLHEPRPPEFCTPEELALLKEARIFERFLKGEWVWGFDK